MKTPKSIAAFPISTNVTSLRQGMLLSNGGNLLRLEEKLGVNWIMRHVDSNETKRVSEEEIYSAISAGVLSQSLAVDASERNRPVIQDNGRLASIAAVRQMREQKAWIDALAAIGILKIIDKPWVRIAVSQLANGPLKGTRKFSLSTLEDVRRRVRKNGGDWTSIIPDFLKRGGFGISRLDERAERILIDVVLSVKGGDGIIKKKEIYHKIRTTVDSENLSLYTNPIPIPSESTVARRVDQMISAREQDQRNHGKRFAIDKYRSHSTPRTALNFPLLVGEYDDVDSGVFLIDERNGLPFGRGYLTNGICRCTLVPLGYSIGYEYRSFESAIEAISDSLIPKDTSRAEFKECSQPWIGYGWQGEFILDNARYNKSQSIDLAVEPFNIALTLVRPYTPTEKSAIEHFNHVIKSDFCPRLPGWRGDKYDSDSVKAGINDAILTINQFRKLYVQWVTGVYLNMPGQDGKTPTQRWMKYFNTHSPSIRWTRQQISLFRLRPRIYTFRESGGILRYGITYDCPQLQELRERLRGKAKAVVYSDFNDLTYVKVLDPYTKTLINASCTCDPAILKGLTERQQKLIFQFARKQGHKNPSIAILVRCREELAAEVANMMRSTKLTLRKKGLLASEDSPATLNIKSGKSDVNSASTASTTLVTELEMAIDELANMEIPMDEEWA